MKQKKAEELRASWGEKPCDHPAFAKEYDAAGERTGSYICTQCGKTISFRERAEIRATRPGLTEE